MKRFHEFITEREHMTLEHILDTLRDTLPDTARSLIIAGRDRDTLSHQEQAFSASPDDPAEHSPMWHQYGILTHSEEFRRFIETGAPGLMKKWGLLDEYTIALSEEVDGMPKADLLQIASLVHDLGKFTARTFEKKDGVSVARFVDHEAHSGTILRSTFKETLQELDLTDAQIEYIAQCAEYHFELGKMRRVALEQEGNYNMAFAKSDGFKKAAQKIIDSNPDLALEIGLMFIADSLSKTEVTAKSGTDEEIEAQRAAMAQEIKDKNLDPRLINQALQQPVNMEIGKQYLQLWAANQ